MLIGNLEGQLTMQGNYQKYNILGESYQGDGSIGFGFAGGDIFYGYGNLDKSGFVQDFSGAGRGSVYVR